MTQRSWRGYLPEVSFVGQRVSVPVLDRLLSPGYFNVIATMGRPALLKQLRRRCAQRRQVLVQRLVDCSRQRTAALT